jgi:hypothetical protein
MKRTWTIIGVADVPASFKWYQSLLGVPSTAPSHDYFGNGLLLFFRVDDFNSALPRARARQPAARGSGKGSYRRHERG